MKLFWTITLAIITAVVLLAVSVTLIRLLGWFGLLILFILFCLLYPLYIGIKDKRIAKKRRKAAAYKNYKEKHLHGEL